MKTHTAHISEQGTKALAAILGHPITAVQSDMVDIYPDYTQSLTFALRKDTDSHCFVHADWLETPKTESDYFQFVVECAASDDYIAGLTATVHFENQSPIAAIDILRKHEELFMYGDNPTEAVDFDVAIIFKREDETAFVLEIPNTITGIINLYELDETRKEFLENSYSIRQTIS